MFKHPNALAGNAYLKQRELQIAGRDPTYQVRQGPMITNIRQLNDQIDRVDSIAASLGLEPEPTLDRTLAAARSILHHTGASTVPLQPPGKSRSDDQLTGLTQADLIARYNAVDPSQRTEWYRKNKEAYDAAWSAANRAGSAAPAVSKDQTAILEEYNAITDARERTTWYRKNKDAYDAAYRAAAAAAARK